MTYDFAFDSIEQARNWFEQRRWYGDKGRDLRDVRTSFRAEATVGPRKVLLELVALKFAAGSSSMYLLVRGAGATEQDGIEDAGIRAWLIAGFQERRTLASDAGEIRWSPTTGISRELDVTTADSRVFRGEQSNSSIVYGDRVMFKLFRKIQVGDNPEVEIGRHLTSHTDFDAFPKLLGTVEFNNGGQTMTLAAAQQFIPSKGDAWSWYLNGLGDRDFMDEAIDASRLLGRRTAEMHVALATGEHVDFRPELIGAELAEAVYRESISELEATIDLLNAQGIGDARDLSRALRTALEPMKELEGTYRLRMHGDYHLGQVLRTNDDDFAILDFEGEPSRSLEERRMKASPLRDVAGMLRSFDYAAESASRAHSYLESSEVARWRAAAREAFLEGYTSTVQGSDTLSHGLDDEVRRRVIAAFEAHKALYEVRYELGNRPEWLDIPLGGLRRIAAGSHS